jgi:hypothetical protein
MDRHNRWFAVGGGVLWFVLIPLVGALLLSWLGL